MVTRTRIRSKERRVRTPARPRPQPPVLEPTPIYDQMIAERGGRKPGEFAAKESI